MKLRKKREKVTQQVQDTSIFSLFTKTFFKIFLLVFFGAVVLIPFAYMFIVANLNRQISLGLKNGMNLFENIAKPKEWNIGQNISAAWSNPTNGWQNGYWFSFLLTFSNVIFSNVLKILITMFLGYAFSLKQWRGKSFVWFILMSLLILPEVALLSGQYWMKVRLNELLTKTVGISTAKNSAYLFFNNLFFIAIPFVASIFNALMFRNAFEAIPNRIKEVAMIDNAVGLKYMFKIAIPMVSPTTLTVIILTTLASWNSYLWPSLIAGTNYRVMSVWLFSVGKVNNGVEEIVYPSIKMAGAILVILPMFAFYFVFRKKIMSSISRQGSTIKG
ncbi:carbohydrate ABC transporter permease [Mycoplasmopsis caviae]|uniref:carbohydrate ABC transporter permease n=1 Tax=Mycoplasmopsis caviae TaxID=55603 RepID=UPI002962099A|nr:carbohydrate ABC transporter permease [Mycoplasmopsis caviae]